MTDVNTIALTLDTARMPAGRMRKASLLLLMLPVPDFRWHACGSAERFEVESYIAGKFRQEYAAELSSFAPLLLSMHCKNELSAAVGIRPASSGPLFVEQYLDKPIEQCIQTADSTEIQRDQIVEIGNLVATRRGASQLLFIVLGSLMYEAGYRWLVFSATNKVERITRKFPFPVQVLCASDPARLQGDAGEWGSYYETSPKVIVGDIREAYEKAQNNRLLRMALAFYRPLLGRLWRKMPAVV
jgi:hypothetical protein